MMTSDNRLLDQDTILNALTHHLHSREEIVFAYAHGSLVDGLVPYRDVDVAVYVRPEWVQAHQDKTLAYVLSLSTELILALREEIGLRVPVDVQMLNEAPLPFRMHVVRDGRLLFTHDEELLADFIEYTARRYMDMAPLWREFTKELIRP